MPCNIFAVKELKTDNAQDYNKEVAVLKKLSSERHAHPHLIILLATYKFDKKNFLVFPWAELDLFGYWNTFKDPPRDEGKGRWVIDQCLGLVEALHKLHRYETLSGSSLLDAFQTHTLQDTQKRPQIGLAKIDTPLSTIKSFYGRHGDVKPANILWFPTTGKHGILKITDFGIARFSEKDLWVTRKHGRVPNSPSYRSPECDLDGKLSSACDVWALGCVYLEFLTWYFGGHKYLKQFGERRLAIDCHWANMKTDTFFAIEEHAGVKSAKVKDSVRQVSASYSMCCH